MTPTPPGDMWQHLETFWVVISGGGGGLSLPLVGRDRGAAKHPTMYRTGPPTAGIIHSKAPVVPRRRKPALDEEIKECEVK